MNHEALPAADPSPRQMQRLAGYIMSEAVDRGKMRELSRQGKARFFVDETEFLQDTKDGLYSLRHRLAARVAKQTVEVPVRNPLKSNYDVGIPEWNLQMYDTQWFEQDAAEWIGSRSLYRFVWSSQQVLRAERATTIVPRESTRSLSDHLEQIDVANRSLARDDFVDFLHVQNEYQSMNAGDVDELLGAVDEYFTVTSR